VSITDEYYTVQEAAHTLGVTRQNIHAAINKGTLAALRMAPRVTLITRESVERYRLEHLGRPGPQYRSPNE